jgi:hypothetical protein
MVGTPAATVGRSASIRPTIAAGCMCRSGMIRVVPDSNAANGKPHEFTWNIGTIGSTRSCSDRANELPKDGANACR